MLCSFVNPPSVSLMTEFIGIYPHEAASYLIQIVWPGDKFICSTGITMKSHVLHPLYRPSRPHVIIGRNIKRARSPTHHIVDLVPCIGWPTDSGGIVEYPIIKRRISSIKLTVGCGAVTTVRYKLVHCAVAQICQGAAIGIPIVPESECSAGHILPVWCRSCAETNVSRVRVDCCE